MMHRAAALAALVLGGAAAGCAQAPRRPAGAAANPAALRLEVDAPEPLAALLGRHLDLARLTELAPAEQPDAGELARLVGTTAAQARALAATEGYFAPVVRVERRDATPPAVHVRVEPGPQAVVDAVTLEMQGPLAQAAAAGDTQAQALLDGWRHAWALPAGASWRDAAWRDAKQAALARLRAAGYVAATWRHTAAQVDAGTARLRLILVADSGPLFRLGALRIEGLRHHDESGVRPLAGFEPGAVATDTRLLDFQERLLHAGLFDSAAVSIDPDPGTAAAASVLVQVREAPRQQATVGLGYSANTGARASLEHRHRRLAGLPLASRNQFEWARLRQAWEGELRSHPRRGGAQLLLGGAVERLDSTSDVVRAVRLRAGRETAQGGREALAFVEIQRARHEPRARDTLPSGALAVSANLHRTTRRLDSALLPTDGHTLAWQAGLGVARDDESRGAFARAWARGTLYRPLGASWFGQARVELGQVFARDGLQIPETLRFRAGGDDSVRGYAPRSLAPTAGGAATGGRVVATASVELARPLPLPVRDLWAAAFVDAGQAANRWRDLDPARGAGVGLRWRSPVGPLRFDLAWGEATRRWRLHASVGVAL